MIQQIKKIKQNINSFKSKTQSVLEMIKNNKITKAIYWISFIFLWWPVKFSFLFMYYIVIWPFVKIFGSSGSSSSGTSFLDGRRRWWSVQVFERGMWFDRFTSQNEDKNYISTMVTKIHSQNSGKKIRAIYKDTGELIESS